IVGDMKNLINPHFNDCYFSNENGYLESRYVFIEGNEIELRDLNNICIGETGFGTGLNLLVLEDVLREKKSQLHITFTTIEKYPLAPEAVRNSINLLEQVSEKSLKYHMVLYNFIYENLIDGWNSHTIKREWGILNFNLFIGDVMDAFTTYPVKNMVWFLDGHSPDKNPEMWTVELFKKIGENSAQNTSFSTFTAAGIVKQGLRKAGFFVKRHKGFGSKRHMIKGTYLYH
ncbi:MAG: tRNA (5-methylaminomethyl-2-thiouridine)(34)-methyltransferase MnmD, partial [Spirochaetales bacterium]|nr:tRNA (5-methylaminomethyl-2-thiouridine)(34)-methyltransferase MnmD [Spirochaetales bacterium]